MGVTKAYSVWLQVDIEEIKEDDQGHRVNQIVGEPSVEVGGIEDNEIDDIADISKDVAQGKEGAFSEDALGDEAKIGEEDEIGEKEGPPPQVPSIDALLGDLYEL